MATTAILHANDVHKSEQSPRSVSTTNSPLVHGYSPNQMSTYNVTGVSPAEAATASTCGSSYQQPSYPLQPSRNVYQNLTPEPPSSESTSLIELGTPVRIGNAPVTSSAPSSDVIIVRDPFYEPPRKRTPNTQRPPQYLNTGNPMYSGGQLELPRNVRVPYPESAFAAVAAVNKAFASYTSGMCMQPRSRPMPYMTPQMRSAAYGMASMPNGMSPSYASATPPPNAMPPAYGMHGMRQMSCSKTSGSQISPGPYQFYPTASNPMPPVKKQSPLTSTKKAKQQTAKAHFDGRVTPKNTRKNDYTGAPVSNIYEQIPDAARPSTSAAPSYAMMAPPMSASTGIGMMRAPSPSISSPSTSQMMTPNVRHPYPYDASSMTPNNPNMQQFDAMRSMGSPTVELMQPPPLPMMRPNGHLNGTKPVAESPMMAKSSMMSPGFSQQATAIHEMQPDLHRMCDSRAPLKSPQYQSSMMASSSGQLNDMYGSMNGSMTSSPSYMQANVMVLQRCGYCKEEFRGDRIGIQCTGNNQGCRRFFHQECSQLLPESFHAILNEPRAEWICNECVSRQQQIAYS
uniref:PHD-type domain-containing protein n=1 Tax=Parascaris univalens TaxID=6257 RepID=A0A915C8D2_PARUN